MRAGEATIREVPPSSAPVESTGQLLRALLVLAAPVLAEQVLHMVVGLTDTYLANHVIRITPDMAPAQAASAGREGVFAGAAVGTINYLMWFVGLVAAAVGTGSTAIISRATGARHRSLANSICGQSIGLALFLGAALGVLVFALAGPIVGLTGLQGRSVELAHDYLRVMAIGLPVMVFILVGNACLRGAGDTVTPMITMIVVDVVNLVVSFTLTWGLFGFEPWGFRGIAVGTLAAYCVGGIVQAAALLIGRGGIRLYPHRLRPHWHNMRRLLRIGIPSGIEGGLQWGVNFFLIYVINRMDASQASGAAHAAAVRIEAVSYLAGFAMATASATMVGQSLGMKNPLRARRSAYLAFALGGTIMGLLGVAYVLFGRTFARWMSDDPTVIDLTARCLFVTGFIQCGFAAAIVFSGSLRGAGDTRKVMLINLASLIGVRLLGVIVLAWGFGVGLAGIWVLLSVELFVRGLALFARFRHGGWMTVRV
jgi:putative MATE family efflux protein